MSSFFLAKEIPHPDFPAGGYPRTHSSMTKRMDLEVISEAVPVKGSSVPSHLLTVEVKERN